MLQLDGSSARQNIYLRPYRYYKPHHRLFTRIVIITGRSVPYQDSGQ